MVANHLLLFFYVCKKSERINIFYLFYFIHFYFILYIYELYD